MQAPLLPTDHPLRRAGFRVEDRGEAVILRDPQRREVLSLNDTALALWELCDGSTSPRQMLDGVCELFDVAREQAAADIERVLDEFTRAGLIDWVVAPTGDRR
ncbi:MAG: PqqD family protein [Egibacteraceae bacterium]|jgi:pyrroloquinoline quinone biosynthesis protein D